MHVGPAGIHVRDIRGRRLGRGLLGLVPACFVEARPQIARERDVAPAMPAQDPDAGPEAESARKQRQQALHRATTFLKPATAAMLHCRRFSPRPSRRIPKRCSGGGADSVHEKEDSGL